ncbi:PucR family transcriptional regulator [Clostridium felsineum]|uniref:PucR family transcriptional regulator n=1 Tax=Clostridium felsineum TaxID=36839 RepID=UPI00214DD3D0|nr:PucR family transcriptional regulator [Clostridium felsineum]MCR3759045.1 PucR family transcriptional regulator [Clostridium felsineum]
MLTTCKSILKLPYLEKIKVVAGEEGLNRIIRWVQVVEYPEYSKWLKGGELILISGIGIKNNINALVDFIKDINSRNLSGIVISVGPYIKGIPKEVVEIGNQLNFPVFQIPFEVKFIDVSQSICKAIFANKVDQESMDNFMKDIIFRDFTFSEDILNRAMVYGYDPKKNYTSFVIGLNNTNNTFKDNLPTKHYVEQIVIDVLNKWKKKSIYIMQYNSIILMIPENKKITMNNIAKNIIESINLKTENINVNIGIGGGFSDLKDFKTSVNEAHRCLKVLKLNREINAFKSYDELGIYKLFFKMEDQEEMKKFYLDTLGELMDYDLKNSTDLMGTLDRYIRESGNINKTAEELFIHRNTLKYRIKRIEEISKCNLRDINVLFNFDTAIKIKKFLKMESISL